MLATLKHPNAWLPIVLSLGIVAMLAGFLVFAGAPSEPAQDEGVVAHLFQLWLVLEALMIPFFALIWLPRMPKEASLILATQIFLVLAGMFPVWYFQL